MSLTFIYFGTILIKLKLWFMVLTAYLIQKETKRRWEKDVDRWIQIPLIWVLTLRGPQINQWVRESAVRWKPEYWWQQLSVCLPVFWDHHQDMRSLSRPERTQQDTGPPENYRVCSILTTLPRGQEVDTQALVFYLRLLRCESIWVVGETYNGKTWGKPRSLGKIVNNLIH